MSVAIVTGAGGGVGKGIALALATAGHTVVVAARRPETGEAVAKEVAARGGSAIAIGCDVTVADDVTRLVDTTVAELGSLDHVVHNASSGRSSEVHHLADVDEAQWLDHAGVALVALHRLCRASYPHLRAAGGSLLVLTSPAGIEGTDTLPLYGVVKAGQRGFLKALAREWGPHGIRVNGLAPLAATPAMVNAFAEDPTLEAKLAASTPLGRLGDGEHDIGPVAAFLCSDAARYVTGQTLVVSGGRFTAL